jgi:hypothetical protein
VCLILCAITETPKGALCSKLGTTGKWMNTQLHCVALHKKYTGRDKRPWTSNRNKLKIAVNGTRVWFILLDWQTRSSLEGATQNTYGMCVPLMIFPYSPFLLFKNFFPTCTYSNKKVYRNCYHVNNSKQLTLSWRSNNFPYSPEIPRILSGRKLHYHEV